MREAISIHNQHDGHQAATADSLDDALRFRRAMEIETVGIALFSPEGPILRANRAFLRMTGYTQEDIQAGRLHRAALTAPEWQQAAEYALQQYRTAGTVPPYEKQYVRKDGSRFWVFIASKKLSPLEGIAFVIDITERKLAETRLREAQLQMERNDAQLQTITDALPTLIAYLDPGLYYLRVNRAYAMYFNTTPEQLVGRHIRDVLGTAFPEIEPHLKGALAGQSQTFEVTIPAALGARQMLAQHIPDIAADGRVCGIVIQSHDMTERKQTEHLLRTAEKLAAVGRLAASMAHEINNPLESVTNLLYLARTSDDVALTRQYLLKADLELRRVSAITNQTLRFHKQSTRPLPLHAHELLESVLTVYSGRLSNGRIRVEQRLRARAPVVCFDGEIRQVLSNLASNALDAMSGSEGRFILRAAEITDRRADRPCRLGLRLTVADTGAGISPENLARIWEAFFTTKEIGGTGLGLWISRDIVARHAGSLRVRSRVGRGTVFTLWLPYEAAVR